MLKVGWGARGPPILADLVVWARYSGPDPSPFGAKCMAEGPRPENL